MFRFAPPIVLVAALSGCSASAGRAEKEAGQDSQVVAHETRRIWESLRDHGFAEKADFIEKARAALERVEHGVSEFETKARRAFGEDPSWAQVADELRARGEAARKSLAGVENATSETWEALKSSFFIAITDLRKTVDGALSKLQ